MVEGCAILISITFFPTTPKLVLIELHYSHSIVFLFVFFTNFRNRLMSKAIYLPLSSISFCFCHSPYNRFKTFLNKLFFLCFQSPICVFRLLVRTAEHAQRELEHRTGATARPNS